MDEIGFSMFPFSNASWCDDNILTVRAWPANSTWLWGI